MTLRVRLYSLVKSRILPAAYCRDQHHCCSRNGLAVGAENNSFNAPAIAVERDLNRVLRSAAQHNPIVEDARTALPNVCNKRIGCRRSACKQDFRTIVAGRKKGDRKRTTS